MKHVYLPLASRSRAGRFLRSAALAGLASLSAALAQDVTTPPGAMSPAQIDLELLPGKIHLSWDTDGILETSPDLRGPWKPLTEGEVATDKQADLPLNGDHRFFRVRERDGRLGEIVPLIEGLPVDPPRFADVTLGKFDGSKAAVRATLASGQKFPEIIPFFVDEDVVLMHDDGQNGDERAGDGVYAGEVPLSLEEVRRMEDFLNKLPDSAPQFVPDFSKRGLVLDRVNGADEKTATISLEESRKKLAELLQGGAVKLPIHVAVPPSLFPRPGPGTPPPIPGITPCDELPTWQKCLLIHDLSVVEDPARTFDPTTGAGTPMGAWTFGRLMTDAANTPLTGITPSDFARRWLRSWQINQMINNDPVPNRNAGMIATILQRWQEVSGGPGAPLSMEKAPFRLLAIVNRLDLRDNITYGGTGPIKDECDPPCTSGEGRFVFCFADPRVDQGGGGYGTGETGSTVQPGQRGNEFLVIFEFCIPKHNCMELKAFAQEWANLQCLPFGPVYNAALQKITDQFAVANAAPGRPNNSALNQLRTNENLLDPLWELREFRIFKNDSDAGHLRPVTVKQTPREDSDATELLKHYITTTLPSPPLHQVPLEWGMVAGGPKQPFLGGRAVMSPISVTSGSPAWATTGASVNNILRHDFALETCSGCHETETATRFVHVGCRVPGQPAPLSGFMIGNGMGGPFAVTVPGTPAMSVGFFDLQRREQDLIDFLLRPCALDSFVTPMAGVH